jgi:hypothetical protein
MSGSKDAGAEHQAPRIQLDAYGIKASVSPSGRSDEDPSSWRHVAESINADLRGITSGIFKFLNATVKSATAIVRGIGDLPGAAASRIKGAHRKADELESSRQEVQSLQKLVKAEDRDAALERIRDLLRRKAVEGMTVRAYSDGQRFVIWISTPMDDAEVEEIVRASLNTNLGAQGALTGANEEAK